MGVTAPTGCPPLGVHVPWGASSYGVPITLGGANSWGCPSRGGARPCGVPVPGGACPVGHPFMGLPIPEGCSSLGGGGVPRVPPLTAHGGGGAEVHGPASAPGHPVPCARLLGDGPQGWHLSLPWQPPPPFPGGALPAQTPGSHGSEGLRGRQCPPCPVPLSHTSTPPPVPLLLPWGTHPPPPAPGTSGHIVGSVHSGAY